MLVNNRNLNYLLLGIGGYAYMDLCQDLRMSFQVLL